MASEKKKRKTDKKLHWGRGKSFLKEKAKGIKGISFYSPAQRQINMTIPPIEESSDATTSIK